MKEPSERDDCMELIVDHTEGSMPNENDSDRTQTHEVIEVIGSIFVNFANLKDFN